MVSRFYL